MKRHFSFLLALSVIAVLFASALNAQPRQRTSPRGERGFAGARLAEELGLTDQQKEQIRSARLETRKKNIDTEAKQKLARLELHELMSAETPDQKKIDAKISELSKLHEAKMRTRIEAMLAMQKVLTPEQRAKMKDLRPFRFYGQRENFGGGSGMGRHWRHHQNFDLPESEDMF